MNGLRSAIGFLTILPLAPAGNPASLAQARGWFPLVGLLIGAILVGVDALFVGIYWPTRETAAYARYEVLLGSAVLIATLAALTRALHLDGFMDSCDALLGGFDRERRLAILRDPHVGAFAVVGAVCLLLFKFAALSELPWTYRSAALLLFPCLSRWAMLLTMELYPYIRSGGLGTAFFDGGRRRMRWQLVFGFGCALLASVALAGVGGVILLAAACGVAWGIGAWAERLLGGATGDIYGAVNEVAEVAVLALIVLLARSPHFALQSPLLDFLRFSLP